MIHPQIDEINHAISSQLNNIKLLINNIEFNDITKFNCSKFVCTEVIYALNNEKETRIICIAECDDENKELEKYLTTKIKSVIGIDIIISITQ